VYDLEEENKLMDEFHKGICGGHHATNTTTHKILRGGYSCHPCQFFTGKQKLASLPLQPVVVEAPFQQWGLDFIGEFKDNSSNGHKWILTSIDYFTRWVEAIPTKRATNKVVMDFLEERIITHFGVPAKITTDNAKAFSSVELSTFCFIMALSYPTPPIIIPKEMVSLESSKKNLMTILKKTVGDNKKSWDSKIKYALWDDRITKKDSTRKSPFELVYGMEVTLLQFI
jgi:hypothetical protein